MPFEQVDNVAQTNQSGLENTDAITKEVADIYSKNDDSIDNFNKQTNDTESGVYDSLPQIEIEDFNMEPDKPGEPGTQDSEMQEGYADRKDPVKGEELQDLDNDHKNPDKNGDFNGDDSFEFHKKPEASGGYLEQPHQKPESSGQGFGETHQKPSGSGDVTGGNPESSSDQYGDVHGSRESESVFDGLKGEKHQSTEMEDSKPETVKVPGGKPQEGNENPDQSGEEIEPRKKPDPRRERLRPLPGDKLPRGKKPNPAEGMTGQEEPSSQAGESSRENGQKPQGNQDSGEDSINDLIKRKENADYRSIQDLIDGFQNGTKGYEEKQQIR